MELVVRPPSLQLGHLVDQALPGVPDPAAPTPGANAITIRGVTLALDELVAPRFLSPDARERLHAALQGAAPFPHLVIDGLFNPRLLELVAEEFDAQPQNSWAEVKERHAPRRSVDRVRLGPASQLYFDIVHSGWFVEWLGALTGVQHLLPDPSLYGGGLHESLHGANFPIHRDFGYHAYTGLKNEMVLITYLNKGWLPEWGGVLELWDKRRGQCVSQVVPVFGRTILMRHGPASFHGHPVPVQPPDARTRRSIAAYYYTGHERGIPSRDHLNTVFLHPLVRHRVVAALRQLTPPILWTAAKKILQR